jgi:hypothetical protein
MDIWRARIQAHAAAGTEAGVKAGADRSGHAGTNAEVLILDWSRGLIKGNIQLVFIDFYRFLLK